MATPRQNLFLVDGSGYLFRAFFGLPQLTNSRGMPTGAIYGFVRMLFKLLKDSRPTHIAVVFDAPSKTFRDDLFQDYKANRLETPTDLQKQIPYMHRAVDAFRIPRLVIEGYEADDVIGTLAIQGAADSFDAVIVTGDKDFMQLVGPHITLWDTMFDRRTGAREVRDRFGVEPRAIIEIMALMGDAIDNVKGVPGVGEKTATALIQHFGSLNGLYKGLDRLAEVKARIPKKLGAVLAEHRADAELARRLVSIDTGVPLELTPDQLVWPGIDQDAVAALLRELEFGSLLAELTPAAAAPPIPDSAGEVTLTAEHLGGLESASRLSVNLGGDPSGAVVLKVKADTRRSASGAGQASLRAASEISDDPHIYVCPRDSFPLLADLLARPTPPKACHDVKRHLRLAHDYGLQLRGLDFDTMLAGYLINPGRAEPSLLDLYHEHLAPLGGAAAVPAEPAIVESLRGVLRDKLDQNQLGELYDSIEFPLASVLAEMERNGILVDAAALRSLSDEFGGQLAQLESECFKLAGHEFNLNSPIQLRTILFDELKLTAKGLKKTKSGYSTDADALEKLSAIHPLPAKLLQYRALAKLKSTYSDALPGLLDPATGRIHTSFHQALAATGRLSSTDPNLQNIPTRTEAGRRIRRAFVAPPDHLLLSADYSQVELRILAHLSGDATLLDAFIHDQDIHARTAAEVLGAPPDDRDARRRAKIINFGIIYGMGPQRLAAELEIPLAAAADFIKRYFERLPGVKNYLDETLRAAREHGFVTTMYGRRRYLPELNGGDGGARAQAERIATNTPIQGSAADLIKIAMVRLAALLPEHQLDARILLQVHDELLLEVPATQLDSTCALVRDTMEHAATLKVPVKVDLKAGPTWAELSPL